MQKLVFDNGNILAEALNPMEIHQYLLRRAEQLPDEHKRFIMPHIYKVGISPGVLELRNQLIAKYDKK